MFRKCLGCSSDGWGMKDHHCDQVTKGLCIEGLVPSYYQDMVQPKLELKGKELGWGGFMGIEGPPTFLLSVSCISTTVCSSQDVLGCSGAEASG